MIAKHDSPCNDLSDENNKNLDSLLESSIKENHINIVNIDEVIGNSHKSTKSTEPLDLENENTKLLNDADNSNKYKQYQNQNQKIDYQALKFQINAILKFLLHSVKYMFSMNALSDKEKQMEPEKLKRFIENDNAFNLISQRVAKLEFNDLMDFKTKEQSI